MEEKMPWLVDEEKKLEKEDEKEEEKKCEEMMTEKLLDLPFFNLHFLPPHTKPLKGTLKKTRTKERGHSR